MYCILVLVRMLQGKDGSVQLGVEHQLLCASVGQRLHGEVTTIAAVSGTTGQRRVGETKKVWTGARQVLRQLASSLRLVPPSPCIWLSYCDMWPSFL